MVKFSKGRCRAVHLRRNKPLCQCRVGADLLENRKACCGKAAGGHPGVLEDSRVVMNQQYALVVKKATD